MRSSRWPASWHTSHGDIWPPISRRRHRRLDAATRPPARLPDPHPAGQGLFADDAAAGGLPAISDDLRGARVAVTPFQSGYRLGSTMEFAGLRRLASNRARLQLLKDGAAPYLREPFAEPVEEDGTAGGR